MFSTYICSILLYYDHWQTGKKEKNKQFDLIIINRYINDEEWFRVDIIYTRFYFKVSFEFLGIRVLFTLTFHYYVGIITENA